MTITTSTKVTTEFYVPNKGNLIYKHVDAINPVVTSTDKLKAIGMKRTTQGALNKSIKNNLHKQADDILNQFFKNMDEIEWFHLLT